MEVETTTTTSKTDGGGDLLPGEYFGRFNQDFQEDFSEERKTARKLGLPLSKKLKYELPAKYIPELQMVGKPIDLCHLHWTDVGVVTSFKPDINKERKTANAWMSHKYRNTPEGRFADFLSKKNILASYSLDSNEWYDQREPDKVKQVEALRVAAVFNPARDGSQFTDLNELRAEYQKINKQRKLNAINTKACSGGGGESEEPCNCSLLSSFMFLTKDSIKAAADSPPSSSEPSTEKMATTESKQQTTKLEDTSLSSLSKLTQKAQPTVEAPMGLGKTNIKANDLATPSPATAAPQQQPQLTSFQHENPAVSALLNSSNPAHSPQNINPTPHNIIQSVGKLLDGAPMGPLSNPPPPPPSHTQPPPPQQQQTAPSDAAAAQQRIDYLSAIQQSNLNSGLKGPLMDEIRSLQNQLNEMKRMQQQHPQLQPPVGMDTTNPNNAEMVRLMTEAMAAYVRQTGNGVKPVNTETNKANQNKMKEDAFKDAQTNPGLNDLLSGNGNAKMNDGATVEEENDDEDFKLFKQWKNSMKKGSSTKSNNTKRTRAAADLTKTEKKKEENITTIAERLRRSLMQKEDGGDDEDEKGDTNRKMKKQNIAAAGNDGGGGDATRGDDVWDTDVKFSMHDPGQIILEIPSMPNNPYAERDIDPKTGYVNPDGERYISVPLTTWIIQNAAEKAMSQNQWRHYYHQPPSSSVVPPSSSSLSTSATTSSSSMMFNGNGVSSVALMSH